MSLEENLSMPFIDEHQPTKMSKVASSSDRNSQAIPVPTTNMGRGKGMRGIFRGRAINPLVKF
jgi:hypothetical protein